MNDALHTQDLTVDQEMHKMKAMFTNVVDHQIHDQNRIGLLESAVRQLAELPTRMHTVENLVSAMKSGGAQEPPKKREWITSDAEMDAHVKFPMNQEMRDALQEIADQVGVSVGCLIRQFIVRAVPSLEHTAGPKVNSKGESV